MDDFRALVEDGAERANLAGRMLWAMGLTGSARDVRTQMSDVIDVCRAADAQSRYIELGVLDAAESDPSELGILIDSLPDGIQFVYINRPAHDRTFQIDDVVLSRLEQHAIEHPSAVSVGALAIALASANGAFGRTISLRSGPEGEVGQAAAAFVAFITGDRATDARVLGRRFAVAHDTSLPSVMDSPVAQSMPNWEKFLAGVHDATPRTWKSQAVIADAINEAMSRRGTPLADAATWYELGLFEPHPLALSVQT